MVELLGLALVAVAWLGVWVWRLRAGVRAHRPTASATLLAAVGRGDAGTDVDAVHQECARLARDLAGAWAALRNERRRRVALEQRLGLPAGDGADTQEIPVIPGRDVEPDPEEIDRFRAHINTYDWEAPR